MPQSHWEVDRQLYSRHEISSGPQGKGKFNQHLVHMKGRPDHSRFRTVIPPPYFTGNDTMKTIMTEAAEIKHLPAT
jgi:hypothetical protein